MSINHVYAFPQDAPGDDQVIKSDASGFLSWEADAGGAAEVSVMFRPQTAKLATSNTAVIDAGDKNWRLLFDDDTDETSTWEFILDDDYGAGALSADIYFSMTSGATGAVIWTVEVMAVTPGDAFDVGDDGYDTANSVTQTVQNTAGHSTQATVSLSNSDSAAAGDYIRVRLARDADNGSDTTIGDAELMHWVIRE